MLRLWLCAVTTDAFKKRELATCAYARTSEDAHIYLRR
jgi:hypothetical protein